MSAGQNPWGPYGGGPHPPARPPQPPGRGMPPGPWQYGGGPQPGWAPPPGPPRPPSRRRRLFRLLNPVIAGRQVARPTRPDRVDDPVVRKVQVLRAVVGLIAVVWIMVSYRVTSDAQSLAYERADQIA